MFEVNHKETRTTPMASFWCQWQWRRSDVFIVNFEHVIVGWELT